jgi:hypothetical protein
MTNALTVLLLSAVLFMLVGAPGVFEQVMK